MLALRNEAKTEMNNLMKSPLSVYHFTWYRDFYSVQVDGDSFGGTLHKLFTGSVFHYFAFCQSVCSIARYASAFGGMDACFLVIFNLAVNKRYLRVYRKRKRNKQKKTYLINVVNQLYYFVCFHG